MKSVGRIFFRLVVLGVVLGLTTSCSPFGQLSTVGLDGDGKEVSWNFQQKSFEEDLAQYLTDVDVAVTPSLNKERGGSKWQLGEVGVGLAFRVKAGFGPLMVKGQVGLTAIFSPFGGL